MKTIQPPADITQFLIDIGFKMNGYDFYKSFPLTNFVTEWEEEVYVSLTDKGYVIDYPDSPKKNKVYKTAKGMIKYIAANHS